MPTGGSKKERCCGLLSGGDAHSEWPSDLANVDVSRGHCGERFALVEREQASVGSVLR